MGAAIFVIHIIRGFGALSPTGSPFRALPYPMDADQHACRTPCETIPQRALRQADRGAGARIAISSRGIEAQLLRSTTRVMNRLLHGITSSR
jgi:hypothetical protein